MFFFFKEVQKNKIFMKWVLQISREIEVESEEAGKRRSMLRAADLSFNKFCMAFPKNKNFHTKPLFEIQMDIAKFLIFFSKSIFSYKFLLIPKHSQGSLLKSCALLVKNRHIIIRTVTKTTRTVDKYATTIKKKLNI